MDYMTTAIDKEEAIFGPSKAVDILVFKTNICFKKDIRRIALLFDNHPSITKWSIDVTDIDKVMRTESMDILPCEIIRLVQSTGFYCEELPD
jgi:hypothetical protein